MFQKVTITLASGATEVFFVDDLTCSYNADGRFQAVNFKKPRRELGSHFFQAIHLQLEAIQALIAEPVDEAGEPLGAIEPEPEAEAEAKPKTPKAKRSKRGKGRR